MSIRKIQKQSEHTLQKQCVAWFNIKYRKYQGLLFSVPNGAHLYGNKMQRIKQVQKLKSEGMVKGVSDLILLIAKGNYHGLCIEMKTKAKHSKQSEFQEVFEKKVIEQGFGYAMPRTFKEFQQIITNYINHGEY